MEFYEKLQGLRKDRGLTQEELAEALYVSRTAISKWESGRGYPSIDSLKEISNYFSVTIDDLLSGEKLLSIAEKENKSNIRNICELLFGVMDIFSLMLVVLPLYPNMVDGYVYSVNLFAYTQATSFNRLMHWCLIIALVVIGILKTILIKVNINVLSMSLGILTVFFLAMSREPYAVTLAFMLLLIKGFLLFYSSQYRCVGV